MNDPTTQAPGWPGSPARWTSSAKTGVGTALSFASRVWFTLSHGILNEVYWPRQDRACTRDMGLIVTDGHAFFSEEKRHARSEVFHAAPGVPAYRVVNTCLDGRYRIEKDIIADPARDSVLQRTRFVALTGAVQDYRLYVLLAPHLNNHGGGNTAWTGAFKGVPMLFAERDGSALALGCSAPWRARSVGFVGVSDGWQDLVRNKRLTWAYSRAENGNVALVGEIDLQAAAGGCVLALGFGVDAAEAGHRVVASLFDGFEQANDTYVRRWQEWQRSLTMAPGRGVPSAPVAATKDVYRTSAAVLRTHESKTFPGGMIASLSIPWGFAHGDGDLGGYHLVWPRDLVESASGLLAAGGIQDVRRVLHYLRVTQEDDGHWPQNMWLDGSPYWGGLQVDESALPILLVDLLRRAGHLDAAGVQRYWPMVRKAAGFVVRSGPVTQQDRWEEDPGYSPFTLAAEIAGLLAAADLAELSGDDAVASYLRETADTWNANVERWTYVANTELARRLNVRGYYIRIAPPDVAEAASRDGFVPIKNRPPGSSAAPASHIVSPDALALVRFGLRAPDDPRIVDTVKVIDALLKVDTPAGPAWHRYNGDGYGEHEDGSPFDGTGIGRPWPLLAGERAHYELAAGRPQVAEQLLEVMEKSTAEGRLIPEQLWDAADIPGRELFLGKATGSACPLVWAHSEYIKLRRSLRDNKIFDQPPQTVQRYVVEKKSSRLFGWRFNNKCVSMPQGKVLRVVLRGPALVHWSFDGWQTPQDTHTSPTGLGSHVADLPTDALPAGSKIVFTMHWDETQRWEGIDYSITVEKDGTPLRVVPIR